MSLLFNVLFKIKSVKYKSRNLTATGSMVEYT